MEKSYDFWTKEEIEYLKNNYLNIDLQILENNLNRTNASICHKANKLNLFKQYSWTKREIKYLKNNYAANDSDLLKLNLDNHSWDAIKTKASFLGLKRVKKLAVDEDFFKTWVPEMAYIFGFWIADGNMLEKRNSISFASKDYDLLEIIKSNLKSEHKIGKLGSGFQLQISNKILYNDLFNRGGIPKKSLTIQFPEVPDKYLSHFIRGYLDGDGGFCIKKDRKYRYLRSYFCGNINFLSGLKDKIKENANIDSTSFRPANKSYNQRIYNIEYFGKKAIALGDFIYQDSKNLCLERKFKIYDKMKKLNIIKLMEDKKN